MGGDEVVQLYVSARKHTDKDPIKQLKAFQRISLRKGEMKKVELTVPYTELQVWDEKQNRFILPDKEMTLEIGASFIGTSVYGQHSGQKNKTPAN